MGKVDVHNAKKFLTAENTIFKPGKKNIILCDFDRVFNIDKKNLNLFHVTRKAFYVRSQFLCDNINIFMEYFDPDKELITSYINLKVKVDLHNMTYTFTSFLDDIVNRLFTESMVAKIEAFVEDQYRIDLESSLEKDKYKDNPQQFMNKHGKILMAISTAIKMIIPIISHYYVVRPEMVKDITFKSYQHKCFYSLFPLFEQDTNIYNKLYATVNRLVDNSMHSDKGMWDRNYNKGITPTLVKTRITKMIIQDLIYKYVFSEMMIMLNHTSIKMQLKNILEGKDTHDYIEVTNKRVDNKKSGLEQLEMSAAQIDERDIIISSRGSENKIRKLMDKYDIKISKKDLDFYKNNLELNQFQTSAVLNFFSEEFKGSHNLKFLKKKNFYRLLIIMKTILLRKGFVILPYLISGNTSKLIKGRKISSKKLAKIKNTPRYQKLIAQYSDIGAEAMEQQILQTISLFVNIPMTFVDHTLQDQIGEEIPINIELLSDEIVRMFEMI